MFYGKKPFLIYLGGLFVIGSLICGIKRFKFELAPKTIVIGKMIELKKVEDADGISYQPIYSYIYENKEYIYINSISSFTFKKRKKVGEVREFLINVNNPNESLVNSKLYLSFGYYMSAIFFLSGVILMFFGIS